MLRPQDPAVSPIRFSLLGLGGVRSTRSDDKACLLTGMPTAAPQQEPTEEPDTFRWPINPTVTEAQVITDVLRSIGVRAMIVRLRVIGAVAAQGTVVPGASMLSCLTRVH